MYVLAATFGGVLMTEKNCTRLLLLFIAAGSLFTWSCSPILPEDGVARSIDTIPDVSALPYSDLVINEVCTANSGVILDEAGDDPDWIEIINQGDTAIGLDRYALSDDSTNLTRWRFGNVMLEPKSLLLVFASGKNVDTFSQTIPDDTVTIKDATRWSDSMDAGGKSSIRTYEYKSIWPIDSEGCRIISATFNLVDNRPALDWSALDITTKFKRQLTDKGNDYSAYSYIELILTLQKDRNLGIRFVQSSLQPWKGALVTVKGTGVVDDHYIIPLEQGKSGLDLTCLTGFYLHAPPYEYGTTDFTLRRTIFRAHQGNLHTSFKLSGKERYLYLSNPDSVCIDRVALQPLPGNASMGRDSGLWRVFAEATPGSPNGDSRYTAVSDTPATVTGGGFYDSAVSVAITTGKSSPVYYTLNGCDPDTTSERYSSPIRIEKSSVLRYRVIETGKLPSRVITESYFIGVPRRHPVVSIAIDEGSMFDPDTGLYMMGPGATDSFPYFGANFWSGKELPATIELYEMDGKKRFSIGGGLSISGNWSKGMARKSLTFDFREEYGTSELDYPLFPDRPKLDKFKKIVLRSGGGTYSKAFINDPMMQSLIDERDIDHQQCRPVVVYINGRYFGLHNLKEPTNHDYVYTNYGYKKEEIDFFDAEMKMKWGTPDAWNTLVSLLRSGAGTECTDTMNDSVYSLVKKVMDVHNFGDYHAFEIYINNTDWPANNCRFWRERTGKEKWRWLIYDLDAGFGDFGYEDGAEDVTFNTLAFALDATQPPDAYPNGTDYTFPLRALLTNERFRNDFINRFAVLLATDFSPERVKARIDAMADEIRDEIPDDAKRWDYTVERWEQDLDKLRAFADERAGIVLKQLMEQFGATETWHLTLESSGAQISVNGMEVGSGTFTGTFFKGIPVELEVKKHFGVWSDGVEDNPRIVTGDEDTTIGATGAD